MKKMLSVVIIAALALGIVLSVPKAKNQAGDPPVGKRITASQVALGGMHTLGDPPVG